MIQISYIFCPPLCEVEKALGTRLMVGERLIYTAHVYPFWRLVSGNNFSAYNQAVNAKQASNREKYLPDIKTKLSFLDYEVVLKPI